MLIRGVITQNVRAVVCGRFDAIGWKGDSGFRLARSLP